MNSSGTTGKKISATIVLVALIANLLVPGAHAFADEATTTDSTASSSETVAPTTDAATTTAPADQSDTSEATTASTTADATPSVPTIATSTLPITGSTTDAVDAITASTTDAAASTTQSIANDLASTTGFMASTTENLNDLVSTATTSASTTPTATSTGPSIVSGTALALADILNILNSNFFNSTGTILFSNYTDPTGTIDVRSNETSTCSVGPCTSGDTLQINLIGDGTIGNTIAVNANSGGNTIDGGGDASILSGNAFAGLNLVNIANANFINTNYFLMAMNAFQGVDGDVVLPGITDFFPTTGTSTSLSGTIQNTGTAITDGDVSASSGNNTSSNNASSTIATGTANSYLNVFNQINKDVQDNAVSILLNVSGNWSGHIVGIPDGVTLTQDPSGLFTLSRNGSNLPTLMVGTLNASTTASIANTVQVAATTGNNSISNASSSLIDTGTAAAGANIVNIANANVIGKNWMLAIINIFGDFNGDIAFGRPDLWVGDRAEIPNNVDNGTTITYTLTVINNGDADASNVVLTDTYDEAHEELESASVPFTTAGNVRTWEIGTMHPGQATEITYRVRVKNTEPGTPMTSTATVTEQEKDTNLADNTDTVTVYAHQYIVAGGSLAHGTPGGDFLTDAADTALSLVRDTATSTVAAGSPIHEKVTVTNTSDATVHDIVLHDVLHAPDGSIVDDEPWNLGDLAPQDAAVVEYDIDFQPTAPTGWYIFSSSMSGDTIASSTLANSGAIQVIAAASGGHLISTFLPHVSNTNLLRQHTEASTTATTTTSAGILSPNALIAGAAGAGISLRESLLLTLVGLIGAGIIYLLAWTRRRFASS